MGGRVDRPLLGDAEKDHHSCTVLRNLSQSTSAFFLSMDEIHAAEVGIWALSRAASHACMVQRDVPPQPCIAVLHCITLLCHGAT
jgi:hypothetical protein